MNHRRSQGCSPPPSTSAVTIEGQPWFMAADVCAALGIRNTGGALVALHPTDKSRRNLGLRGLAPWLVNESGIYKLVMRSNKPVAKGFQHWVTSVVLPAIRKDGAFPVTPSRTRPPAALASQEPAAPVP